MYLLRYSLKNIRRHMTIYMIFGLLLTLLFSVLLTFFTISEKTRTGINEMEREYGCAYWIQENFGHLVPRNIYESMRSIPYVSDIEYRKYTHLITRNNLSLEINDTQVDFNNMLMIAGLPVFTDVPELLAGYYPKDSTECVIMKDDFNEKSLGDIISIKDNSSGIQKDYEIVGVIDKPAGDILLDTSNYIGAIIITTMDSAADYFSPNQLNDIFINGVKQGYDATVYLLDYRYGKEFRQYVSQTEYQSGSYSAIYQKQGFETSMQQMQNLMDMSILLQKIITIISFAMLFLFILVRTNLRSKEICILKSMGVSSLKLVIMSIFEYSCFLITIILLGTMIVSVISLSFIVKETYSLILQIYLKCVPLILLMLITNIVVTSVTVLIIIRLSLIKMLRSAA